MSAKYIFRLDDISCRMNFDNFKRICSIFQEYDIKPLLGVIPDDISGSTNNQEIDKTYFWSILRKLYDKNKCDFAIHGYQHIYNTNDSGILKQNNRSEFSGLSYSEQDEKIKKAIQVFNSKQIVPICFMAPAHSFDLTTLSVLAANGISFLTDGISAYPYKKKGFNGQGECVFIPAQWTIPMKKLFGIHTFVFHINTWENKHFDRLESFIKKNKNRVISFSFLKDRIEKGCYKKRTISVFLSKIIITVEKKFFLVTLSLREKLRIIAH